MEDSVRWRADINVTTFLGLAAHLEKRKPKTGIVFKNRSRHNEVELIVRERQRLPGFNDYIDALSSFNIYTRVTSGRKDSISQRPVECLRSNFQDGSILEIGIDVDGQRADLKRTIMHHNEPDARAACARIWP